MQVCVNGELGPADVLRVSPLDHGLLVGDGVFETLRVYDGVPFAWTRHLQRLERSATGLGLELPSIAMLRDQADRVLAANGLRAARLRITITGGPAPLGSERAHVAPTVVVAASALTPWPETADVVIVPWSRNENSATAGLKTISYADNVRALAFAHEHGASEALFANTRGELCEATGSNVFLVTGGHLTTPPADSGCLLGVTRALVLELARSLGIPASEPPLGLDSIAHADEAFLSSTTREVQAIAHVDGAPLPAAPGPVTRRLAAEFAALVARDVDP
ncbi:MAG: aminotransferase class IV [Acidimicrobiia bacterium]